MLSIEPIERAGFHRVVIARDSSTQYVGVIAVHDVSNGPDSSGIGVGDVTLQAQWRLSQFHEDRHVPTSSLVIQQTWSVHRKIVQLLRDLREAKRLSERQREPHK